MKEEFWKLNYNKDHWPGIQINENETLQNLDQFIRDIWVEPEKKYSYRTFFSVLLKSVLFALIFEFNYKIK